RDKRSERTGWRGRLFRDLPERTGSKELARLCEVRVIEHVVEVRTDAERKALSQLEVLVDGEVRVKEPGPTVLVTHLIRERSQPRDGAESGWVETGGVVL